MFVASEGFHESLEKKIILNFINRSKKIHPLDQPLNLKKHFYN